MEDAHKMFVAVIFLGIFGICRANYVLDDSSGLGRIYDGIGGLSGGGATSKLLINYPQKQRDEILDYLFKPNFGASLQILKVEIGGDSQSTDGTESSHMHEPNDENYHRGYEWWLMKEAKKRNPDIKLYGLPWAFPGWLGVNGNPYTVPNVTATYITKWLVAAKQVHGLTIDFVGIWNERSYDITYIKVLRSILNQNNLQNVKVVAADGNWGISKDILKDAELANAIDYIGVHYPGTLTTDSALQTTKKLWSSEDYSTFNDNVGAGCWARILNQNYVNGHMTSTISWNLIAAYYFNLPFGRDGLMTSMEPWSGHYVVESPIWMTAHTTQFSEIGWQYLMHGSGVGHFDQGGSYVTLTNKDKSQVSIVIETMSHDHSKCIRPALPAYTVKPQNATFKLKGSMSGIKMLNVWYSKLGFDGAANTLMMKKEPVQVVDGMFSLALGVDEMYTLTTLSVGQKGDSGAIPPSKPFPLPYKDDFEGYSDFAEAYNFAPQIGVFEVRESGHSSHGKVNAQVVLRQAIDWCGPLLRPVSLGGNYNWTDISVQVDVYLPTKLGSGSGANGTFVGARVKSGGCAIKNSPGIYFFLLPQEGKFVVSTDFLRTNVVKEGAASMKYDTWYTMKMETKGDQIKGWVNGAQIFEITQKTQPNGFVVYGTDTMGYGYFDNFLIDQPAKDTTLKWKKRQNSVL